MTGFRSGAAVAALLMLAACKGSVTSGPTVPIVNPGGSGALGSYYVTSFTPFEAIASSLRASARYAVQNATWCFTTTGTCAGLTTYDSFPLASARAEYAHAVGLTGAGQIVSVIDGGFLPSHETIAGRVVAVNGSPPVDDHGTKVASVIAGNSSHMIGIAPGAQLALGSFASGATLASATNQALALGAVAQNNSWGFDTLFVDQNNPATSQASFNAVFGNQTGQSYLTALKAYSAQGVVVFAISNDQTHTTGTLMDSLPAIDPTLEPGWLAVGNAVPVFDSQGITSAQMLSAGCFEAARWCLVADGAWEGASATDPTTGLPSTSAYAFSTGSSFAAPQVAGALALLAQAFPNLTPHDLRIRLLASADNDFFAPDGTVFLTPTFSHDYSNTFGHGFLDIRAALLPIGPTSTSLANGTVMNTDQPAIVVGAALGDAVTRSLKTIDVAVNDSLNADFTMPGEALAATVRPEPLGRSLLSKSLSTNLAFARNAPDSALDDPFGAFAGQRLALLDPSGDIGASVLMPGAGSEDGAYGIGLKRALIDGPTRIELGLKLTRDDGSVMGFGATGNAGARMASLELGVTQDLGGGGFVSLGGEVGIADLGSQAALSNVSSARFNSVSLDVGRHGVFADGDRLALGVAMPVAVTSGSASITLPVSRGVDQRSFETLGLDLAPSDRQVDISLSYQRPIAPGLEMMMQLVHAENYGNRAGEEDTAGVLALQFSF